MASATTTVEGPAAKGVGYFNPSWFKELDIQGFPIRHIEAKSEHIQNLKQSIKTNGYNRHEPIILAKSKDCQGMVLDGRHRLIACNYIFQETGKLPNIKIQEEVVSDEAHAVLRQIYYESGHLLRKNSDSAAAHIIELYEDAKQRLPELAEQRNIDEYLAKEAGFGATDKVSLNATVSRIVKYEEKERQRLLVKMQQPRQPAMDFDIPDKSVKNESKQSARELTAELETKCVCGKKTNHAVSIKLYEDGKVKLEQVN